MAGRERLTAVAAAAAIRDGVITSRELVSACLARIREREPDVAAWVHLDAEKALAAAGEADGRRQGGEVLGPLHGVPVGIKDVIDTVSYPTEYGTPAFAGRQPAADAEVVRRLSAAGAVILGKTVTTELAFYGPGKTRNPHDLSRTPGGSSSGSAAAVADFHVPLALGTQTAGSILRPASYCGVWGMKPTYGLVPVEGVLAQSPPLDTIGGYGRSAADVALLVSILSGSPVEVGDFGRPPRLAFVRTPAWGTGEPAMHEAFLRFTAANPGLVTDVALPEGFAGTGGLQRAVQFHDIALGYGPIADRHGAVISAKLKEVIAEGRGVTEAEYEAALSRRETLYRSLDPIFASYDAILTPAAAGPALAGLGATGSPAFNFLWTYLGTPALSVPLLEANDLPIGAQLVARRGADAHLLAVAEALCTHATIN